MIYPFLFLITLDCIDSNNGTTDRLNNTCDYYYNWVVNDILGGLKECGLHDDDDFLANEMCCGCKG